MAMIVSIICMFPLLLLLASLLLGQGLPHQTTVSGAEINGINSNDEKSGVFNITYTNTEINEIFTLQFADQYPLFMHNDDENIKSILTFCRNMHQASEALVQSCWQEIVNQLNEKRKVLILRQQELASHNTDGNIYSVSVTINNKQVELTLDNLKGETVRAAITTLCDREMRDMGIPLEYITNDCILPLESKVWEMAQTHKISDPQQQSEAVASPVSENHSNAMKAFTLEIPVYFEAESGAGRQTTVLFRFDPSVHTTLRDAAKVFCYNGSLALGLKEGATEAEIDEQCITPTITLVESVIYPNSSDISPAIENGTNTNNSDTDTIGYKLSLMINNKTFELILQGNDPKHIVEGVHSICGNPDNYESLYLLSNSTADEIERTCVAPLINYVQSLLNSAAVDENGNVFIDKEKLEAETEKLRAIDVEISLLVRDTIPETGETKDRWETVALSFDPSTHSPLQVAEIFCAENKGIFTFDAKQRLEVLEANPLESSDEEIQAKLLNKFCTIPVSLKITEKLQPPSNNTVPVQPASYLTLETRDELMAIGFSGSEIDYMESIRFPDVLNHVKRTMKKVNPATRREYGTADIIKEMRQIAGILSKMSKEERSKVSGGPTVD